MDKAFHKDAIHASRMYRCAEFTSPPLCKSELYQNRSGVILSFKERKEMNDGEKRATIISTKNSFIKHGKPLFIINYLSVNFSHLIFVDVRLYAL
jgi:hypothetical protein